METRADRFDLLLALITISHRPSLYRYHSFLLRVSSRVTIHYGLVKITEADNFPYQLTGENGEWQFSAIGTQEEQLSLDNEIATLEKKLQELDAFKARVEEINKELSMKSD